MSVDRERRFVLEVAGMATRAPRRTIETTADQLRAIVLDCEVGALE